MTDWANSFGNPLGDPGASSPLGGQRQSPVAQQLSPPQPSRGGPIFAAPQPAGSGTSLSATAAPTPPSFIPVARYFNRLLDAALGREVGAQRRGGLRHVNQLADGYQREAIQFVGLTRAAAELAAYLDNSTTNAYQNTSGQYRDLRTKAFNFVERVESETNLAAPLSKTHERFFHSWKTDARRVYDLLHDAANSRALDTYFNDTTVPDLHKRAFRQFYQSSLSEVSEVLAKSPLHDAQVTMLEQVLDLPGDPRWRTIGAAIGQVALGTIGQMPGPDSFATMVIKIVGTRRLYVSMNSRIQTYERQLRRLRDLLVHAAGFTAEESNTFRTHMAESTPGHPETTPAQKLLARDAARDQLGRKFHGGPGYTLALEVFSILQLFNAFVADGPDERSALQRGNDIASGGVATVAGGFVLLHRLQIGAIGFRTYMDEANAALEAAACEMNCFFAVSGIVSGGITLVGALGDADTPADVVMVGVGGLQIASGMAIYIATAWAEVGWCSALGPWGVALGLVATGIAIAAGTRDSDPQNTPSVQDMSDAYSKLVTAIKTSSSSWDHRPFIDVLGVASAANQLETAAGAARIQNINTGLSDAQFMNTVERLKQFGFRDIDARRMITTSLVQPPRTR